MIFFSPTGNFFTLLEWKILRNALSGSREAFALVSCIWETFIKLLQWSLLELSNFLYCTRYCTNIFHQAFSSREVMSPPAYMGRMENSMHRAVGEILSMDFLENCIGGTISGYSTDAISYLAVDLRANNWTNLPCISDVPVSSTFTSWALNNPRAPCRYGLQATRRRKKDIPALVTSSNRDPNRSSQS